MANDDKARLRNALDEVTRDILSGGGRWISENQWVHKSIRESGGRTPTSYGFQRDPTVESGWRVSVPTYFEGVSIRGKGATPSDALADHAGRIRKALGLLVLGGGSPKEPSLAGKTTYWKGDLAVYTGKTEMLHGGLFYEIELAEGHLKGEKKVTRKGPDPEASGTRYHVARHALGQNVQGALGRGGVEWEVFDSRTSPSTAVFVSRSEDDAIAESRRLNAGWTPQPPGPVTAVDREGREYRSLDDYNERKIREEQEAARKKTDRVPPGKARCSICGKVGSSAALAKHEAKCKTGDCGHGESESGESGDWSPMGRDSFAYLRLDGTRLHVRHNAHVGTWSWSAGSSDGTVLGRGETRSKKTAQKAASNAANEGTR